MPQAIDRTPYFDVDDVIARLAARGVSAARSPSPLSGSPYEAVEVVIGDAFVVVVSDLREWEARDGILVGGHNLAQSVSFGGDVRDFTSIEAALDHAVDLVGVAEVS